MPSTQAFPSRNLASWSERASRLFSRWSHCASTSIPSRSSKESFWISGFFCCSAQAAPRVSRRRVRSFSIVGSLSTTSPWSVVVAAAPNVLVGGARGGLGELLLGRRGQPVEAVLQDRLDRKSVV